jgi:hypothetical protein
LLGEHVEVVFGITRESGRQERELGNIQVIVEWVEAYS